MRIFIKVRSLKYSLRIIRIARTYVEELAEKDNKLSFNDCVSN